MGWAGISCECKQGRLGCLCQGGHLLPVFPEERKVCLQGSFPPAQPDPGNGAQFGRGCCRWNLPGVGATRNFEVFGIKRSKSRISLPSTEICEHLHLWQAQERAAEISGGNVGS